MAAGSLDLNLKVSQQDFENRINIIEERMGDLMNVIDRYNRAKSNLSQFMDDDDSNVQTMIDRIDVNVNAARAEHQHLQEVKVTLQQTVEQMTGMSSKVSDTLASATEAAKETIKTYINAVL